MDVSYPISNLQSYLKNSKLELLITCIHEVIAPPFPRYGLASMH